MKQIVIALTLIAAMCVAMMPTAQAFDVVINYHRATTNDDGSPLALSDIAKTRLMCDGVWVAEEPGADGTIGADLAPGLHECAGSHVRTDGVESVLGNVLIVSVPGDEGPPPPDSQPNAPYLETANVGYAQKD